jgi:hypothetical protein
MKRITHFILVIALILTVALSGCGGGNSGGGPSIPPPGGNLSAPQSINVAAADKQLTVQWSAVDGATGYLVWWGNINDTGTAGKTSHETADTSYTITGLDNGTTYYVFVQAKNSAGISSPSSLANGTPVPSTTVPAAPGTPLLTPENGQLTVKWEAVNGATFYDVYYSIDSSQPGTPKQQNISATSCTITGLNNGTTYYVWVKAGNNVGTSGLSNPATMAPGPPGAPAAPVLKPGNNCINVSWTPVAGATGYEVHYSGDGTEILYTNFNTSGNSYTIPLPDYGTMTYAVWIVAKNDAGKSGNSPSTNIQYNVSIGEIAGGNGSYADGATIPFKKTFSTVPVVVVNAYDASGNPLIAGVQSVEKDVFTIKMVGVGNSPVTGTATVQWVAIVPKSGVEVQAKSGFYQDGYSISFADVNLFSANPIIICSGYGGDDGKSSLMAAPYNITKTGFTVALRDANGDKAQGSVSYIALIPKSNYNYYQEAAIVAGYTMYNNNGSVQFNLTRNADAVLCSAQKDNFAYAVAGRNNSRYGFDLGILDYDGVARTSVWTSWIALGFK